MQQNYFPLLQSATPAEQRSILPRSGVSSFPKKQFALVFFLGLSLLAGCRQPGVNEGNKKPLEVQVSAPVEMDITDYEDFTGQIEPKETVKLQTKVDGFLEKVYFKEGDIVKQGDPLFLIDPDPFLTKLAKIEFSKVMAKELLKRLTNNWKRIDDLKKTNSVSEDEHERAWADFRQGQETLKSVTEEEYNALLDLDYCVVMAPFTGKMSKKFVDEKNWIKGGMTILSTIVSLDLVYVYFNLDEQTWLKIQRLVEEKINTGLKEGKYKTKKEAAKAVSALDQVSEVEMGLGDQEDFPFKGTLDFVDNKLDPSTGTLLARGIFKNPDGLLYPGLFCHVRLPIGKAHKSLLITERALGTDQGQKFVYVVKEEVKELTDKKGDPILDENGKIKTIIEYKADYRKVKIGSLQNGLRVVEPAAMKDGKVVQGLLPEEEIVVNNVQKVRTGQQIIRKHVPMPASDSYKPAVVTNPK